ncbi:POK6 protein, partial [Rostratula benghalensis]|nr:POK6 protein [Rostratula benghalensis]
SFVGNQIIDNLVSYTVVPDWFAQAQNSQMFFHQSSKVLAHQFNLSLSEAKRIVQTCPDCHGQALGMGMGVNPHGLQSLQTWQMDITHVPSFGLLKYLHVTTDTFSHAVWATPL